MTVCCDTLWHALFNPSVWLFLVQKGSLCLLLLFHSVMCVFVLLKVTIEAVWNVQGQNELKL